MLSKETLESYRRMTPGERLQLTWDMQRESEPYLLLGKPEVVRRRFELLALENDKRNFAMLTAIAASKQRDNAEK
jgi:uncharacterized protein YndB with AHSA1/START domain